MSTTEETVTWVSIEALDEIRARAEAEERDADLECEETQPITADCLRLLDVVTHLLAEHSIEPVFENAGNCLHPRPDPETQPGEYDEWTTDHPWGTGPGGDYDDLDDRVCLSTQIGEHCAGCSKWCAVKRGSDNFVHPADCVVRPVVIRALTSGEVPA